MLKFLIIPVVVSLVGCTTYYPAPMPQHQVVVVNPHPVVINNQPPMVVQEVRPVVRPYRFILENCFAWRPGSINYHACVRANERMELEYNFMINENRNQWNRAHGYYNR